MDGESFDEEKYPEQFMILGEIENRDAQLKVHIFARVLNNDTINFCRSI